MAAQNFEIDISTGLEGWILAQNLLKGPNEISRVKKAMRDWVTGFAKTYLGNCIAAQIESLVHKTSWLPDKSGVKRDGWHLTVSFKHWSRRAQTWHKAHIYLRNYDDNRPDWRVVTPHNVTWGSQGRGDLYPEELNIPVVAPQGYRSVADLHSYTSWSNASNSQKA